MEQEKPSKGLGEQVTEALDQLRKDREWYKASYEREVKEKYDEVEKRVKEIADKVVTAGTHKWEIYEMSERSKVYRLSPIEPDKNK